MNTDKKQTFEKRNGYALEGGSYSLVVTALVLAILIVVNLCISGLPSAATRYDISSSGLYSVTSNTKAVVNHLKKDVSIYWIVQANEEDEVIRNLLDQYDALSDHLDVIKKNPDIYPTFAGMYTEETLDNNSLIVECDGKSRVIRYDEIYVTTPDMYAYTYTTSFDGEGAITSAIDYVVSENLPKVYCLTGHGEPELPSTFAELLKKDNIETADLSLMTAGEIPQDAACLMIYAPQSDISEEEKKLISDYADQGGKLMVMAGVLTEGTPKVLYSLLEDRDVTYYDGVVIEQESSHVLSSNPMLLVPDLKESRITEPLIEARYFTIMPLAVGLLLKTGNASQILTTTADSYVKDMSFTTYDKEEGDPEGPFTIALSLKTGEDGEIIWFSSDSFLENQMNAWSSGANCDLAMNCMSELIGEREALSIHSKSLNYHYLTITKSESTLLKAIMIGILPLTVLAFGIAVTIITRRKQK